MSDTAEPLSSSRRRSRYLLRWSIFGMILLIIFGTIIYQCYPLQDLPFPVQAWKWRGEILYDRLKYGRNHDETLAARDRLISVLVRQGAYSAAASQCQAMLTSLKQIGPNLMLDPDRFRFLLADCLALSGREAEAREQLRSALKGGSLNYFYDSGIREIMEENQQDALRVAKFELDVAEELFSNDMEARSGSRRHYDYITGAISNAALRAAVRNAK